jgi:hypothetical protein
MRATSHWLRFLAEQRRAPREGPMVRIRLPPAARRLSRRLRTSWFALDSLPGGIRIRTVGPAVIKQWFETANPEWRSRICRLSDLRSLGPPSTLGAQGAVTGDLSTITGARIVTRAITIVS